MSILTISYIAQNYPRSEDRIIKCNRVSSILRNASTHISFCICEAMGAYIDRLGNFPDLYSPYIQRKPRQTKKETRIEIFDG